MLHECLLSDTEILSQIGRHSTTGEKPPDSIMATRLVNINSILDLLSTCNVDYTIHSEEFNPNKSNAEQLVSVCREAVASAVPYSLNRNWSFFSTDAAQMLISNEYSGIGFSYLTARIRASNICRMLKERNEFLTPQGAKVFREELFSRDPFDQLPAISLTPSMTDRSVHNGFAPFASANISQDVCAFFSDIVPSKIGPPQPPMGPNVPKLKVMKKVEKGFKGRI